MKRIFVIEDNPDITLMLRTLLEKAGYGVDSVDSAEAAQGVLLNGHRAGYDLIISDIGLPLMDGFELAAVLKAAEQTKHIPMIAITGYIAYNDRSLALAAGYCEMVAKPFEPMQIVGVVNGCLAGA